MYGQLPEIETNSGEKVQGFPVQIQHPPKVAVLRLPTNDEIMTYLSAQKSVYRNLGRRQGEGEDLPNPAADQKLFGAIRIDKDGEPFDDAEAEHAVNTLMTHKVMSCEREGQGYEIVLRTLFGDTTHLVRMPFQKELSEYYRGVEKVRDMPHGVKERRFPPEVPSKLYDAVFQDVDGYYPNNALNAVPPHHKRSVVAELISAVIALDPTIDPN